MDPYYSPHKPLDRRQIIARVFPFAMGAGLAFVTVPISPAEDRRMGLVLGSFVLSAAIASGAALVIRESGSRWIEAVPALAYFGVIALLRHAVGGTASGYTVLCFLPLTWLSLYGTRAQLLAGLGVMTVTLAGPIVAIGPPLYPPTEWRVVILWVAVSPLVGFTAQKTMSDLGRRVLSDEHHMSELTLTLSALWKSEARMKAIMDATIDGIAVIDSQVRVDSVNKGAAEMFGYEPDEVPGLPAEVFWAPGALDPILEELTDALAKGKRFTARGREIVGRRRDGSHFPVEVSITQMTDEKDPIFVVVMRDITERKNVQQMKDEFLSVASHELRTPLTSINGALGLIAGGALKDQPDKVERMVAVAAENTARLMRLVNDMLDLERIDSGRLELVAGPVNARDLLDQARETMQPMADEVGVSLVAQGTPLMLAADADRLLQVLINLLGNAVKFSSKGDVVTLRVSLLDDGTTLFEVADQGRGIPPDKVRSIFERFQQVDMSDERQKGGTGLGLAICRAIVDQHGGRIWVESKLGSGSTFMFTIPRSRPVRLSQEAV